MSTGAHACGLRLNEAIGDFPASDQFGSSKDMGGEVMRVCFPRTAPAARDWKRPISLMLGRELQWDPVKEQFVGDEQATALTTWARREGYPLET